MAKFIRVSIPIGSPDGTLKLGKKVSDKHTALGGGSPLTGFLDMAAFESNRSGAALLQKEGDDAGETSQSKYNQTAKLCGIAEGQNKQSENTIYWFTLQSRDVLLLKHKGTEENLEEYGFNVVISQTGARKNVRMDIPIKNPADLLELAADIIEKHTALGAGSPLEGNVDMTLFGTTVTDATALLAEWDTQSALAQSKHNQALAIIGYADGQTSQTVGTLYYDLITARDRLLQFYSGAEQQLEEWGYEVVISSARPGKDSSGTLVFLQEGDVPPNSIKNIPLNALSEGGGGGGGEIQSIIFEATGSTLHFYAAANATDAPGTTVLIVTAGKTIILTPEQAQTQLGFDNTHNFLNVQNTNILPGHFKISFRIA